MSLDRISIDAKILGENGEITAEIDKNEFFINRDNCFRIKRPDASTLVVIDKRAEVVLFIRYMNPSSVRVSGIFRGPYGTVVRIEDGGPLTVNGEFSKISNSVFGTGTKGILDIGPHRKNPEKP